MVQTRRMAKQGAQSNPVANVVQKTTKKAPSITAKQVRDAGLQVQKALKKRERGIKRKLNRQSTLINRMTLDDPMQGVSRRQCESLAMRFIRASCRAEGRRLGWEPPQAYKRQA